MTNIRLLQNIVCIKEKFKVMKFIANR